MSLDLLAPAKLNLFLHIVGRRPNGYHELQSVFILVDLCDTVKLTLREDGKIVRTGDVIGDIDKDLCVKAARLLQSHFPTSFGVEIDVIKRIPAGAGLGGGSSDAATTLMGLNKLWNLQLSTEQLIPLAAKLGADVPFFLLGTNAWVEGIGEKRAKALLRTFRDINKIACASVEQLRQVPGMNEAAARKVYAFYH